MNYPLISEYIESIKAANSNFRTLANLCAVIDTQGNPVMTHGRNSVVFKLRERESGKFYAVKCFTCDMEGRDEAYQKIEDFLSKRRFSNIIPVRYLENELHVNSKKSDEVLFPVVLMDWIDGDTLDNYLKTFIGNSFQLHDLCVSFGMLCKELTDSPLSHGDIRPENIMVCPNGHIVLVDYDAMYVPAMEGEVAREIGDNNYIHPSRDESKFDQHVDDFALAALALSLKATSISYGILDEYECDDAFIFTSADYESLQESAIFQHIIELMHEDSNVVRYINTFIHAYKQKPLSPNDFEFGELKTSSLLKSRSSFGHFSRHNEPIDENGVIYSSDGTSVISFDYDASDAIDIDIKEGVICICEGAFYSYKKRKLNIKLPNSLRFFTRKSLDYSYNRLSWNSPWFTYKEGYIYTSDFTACIVKHLEEATLDSRTKIIEQHCFADLDLRGFVLPENIQLIKDGAFSNTIMDEKLIIPKNVFAIESNAFSSCKQLNKITFNSRLNHIGEWCFAFCKELETAIFTSDCNLQTISAKAFHNCENLKTIQFPGNLLVIDDEAFQWCYSIEELDFPKTLIRIGCKSFNMAGHLFGKDEKSPSCRLQVLILPPNIETIGDEAFNHYISLNNIFVKSPNIKFGKGAFKACSGLYSFQSNGLKCISEKMFYDCNNLELVVCPELLEIGTFAFAQCSHLNFKMPDNLKTIDIGAFNGVKSITVNRHFSYEDGFLFDVAKETLITCNNKLKKIVIPEGTKHVQTGSFANPHEYIIVPNSISDRSISEILSLDVKYVHLPEGRNVDKTLEKIKFDGDRMISLEYDIQAKLYGNTPIYVDQYGVFYSEDKKRLLKYPREINLQEYAILPECEIIEDNAFEGGEYIDIYTHYVSNKLTVLILSKNLKRIGKNGLEGCREIKSLILPQGIVELDDEALNGCHSITELTIPQSVQQIGKNCLPANVQHIESYSVHYKTYGECLLDAQNEILWISPKISQFELPKQVIFKGKKCRTYPNCIVSDKQELLVTIPQIKYFEFPEGIKTIARDAFGNNEKIEKLIIPEGVTTIEYGAFHYNQSLREIYLPKTINHIGNLKTYQDWWRKYPDYYYPKEVHIPKGMRKHFMKLMPDIPEECLIDNIDN